MRGAFSLSLVTASKGWLAPGRAGWPCRRESDLSYRACWHCGSVEGTNIDAEARLSSGHASALTRGELMPLPDVKDRPRTTLEGSVQQSTIAASPPAAGTALSTRMVRRFFAVAFAIGWGIAILMVVFQKQVEALFGEIGYTNPVFIAVVWSPAFAATYLVWRNYGGWSGLRSFYKRTTLWRMPAPWWVLLVVGIPAIVYAGALFAGTVTESDLSPWYSVLGILALTMVIGPIEEIGWRGLALPLLQRRHTPLGSALILGAFWGLWHAPAFLMSGTKQASWSFPAFAIGVLALSVIVTPMFNAAKGSILIAALFHFQVNNPVWPDAQPWDTVVYALVAIAVVWFNRRTMLVRDENAVTRVLHPDDRAAGIDRR